MTEKAIKVNAKVLLISDNIAAGQIWIQTLKQKGLEAVLVGSIEEALTRWIEDTLDLIIFDIYNPQLDEIDLCRQLRAEVINPILLFTSKSDEVHLLEAYEVGLDECIVKPISPLLFLAKVTAWLRRSWAVPAQALDCLQVGDFQLDPVQRHLLIPSGSVVKLTNLEFRLLHLLMSHQAQVLEPNFIIERVWGYYSGGDSSLLKNVVYRLRRKIESDPGQPCYLQTVAGEGYIFQP